MSRCCFDFHLHSLWSYDAQAEVENYFLHARENGVTHLALTEHLNFDSYPDVQKAAKKFPEIGYVTGAELTVSVPDMKTYRKKPAAAYELSEHPRLKDCLADWNCDSFDIVCLGFPENPTGAMKELLQKNREWMQKRCLLICQRFSEAGMPLTPEECRRLILTYRSPRTLEVQGLTHVQGEVLTDYMVKHCHCDPDTFTTVYNSVGREHPYLSVEETVKTVQQAGGIVLLAHPTGYSYHADPYRLDELRERIGFDGMECSNSTPPELVGVFREYCVKHKLLSSGGTDSHKTVECEPGYKRTVGGHAGEKLWLDELLERLEVHHG